MQFGRDTACCKGDVISTTLPTLLYVCQLKNTQSCYPLKFLAPPRSPCQSPSPPFLFLYLLINVWFSAKKPSGHGYQPAQVGLYTKRQLLFNICLPASKAFLFTPLTPPLTFSPFFSFPRFLLLIVLFLLHKLSIH